MPDMNDAQKQAVAHFEGPCRVIAGAGSGKTTVLTHRIENLIKKKGVNPWNILAITFTKKAATEMKERLAKLIGEDVAKKVFLGTFHSFCLQRILYEYRNKHADSPLLPKSVEKNGRSSFEVITEDAQWLEIIYRILSPQTNAKLSAPIESDIDPQVAHGFIQWQKNYALYPGDNLNYSFFADDITDNEKKDYATLYEAFERERRTRGWISFDDMLLYSLAILDKDAQFRSEICNRYKFVLVDEFQDTNTAQYMLVKKLASGYKKNVFIVGDARQAIYGWRAGCVEYILDFEQDWSNPELIELNDNYRSTVEIVDFSTALIANSTIDYPGICRSGWGNHGEPVMCFSAENDREEAEKITGMIQYFMSIDNSPSYEKFAVLYRTNAQSINFVWTFMQRNIPFSVASGENFFDHREIRELLAFMRLANDENDVSAFREIKGVLASYVDSKVLADICDRASGQGESLREAIERFPYDEGSYDKDYLAGDFLYLLDKMYEMDSSENYNVRDTLSELFCILDYEEVLTERYENKNEGRDYASQVTDSILSFIESCDRFDTTQDLLKYIETQKQRAEDKKGAKVQLMTLHRSKGLEFNTVFLPGMVNGSLPHSKSIKYNKKKEVIPESIEEERRLCYVGITRAQERLILSQSETVGAGRAVKSSVFWDELYEDMNDVTDAKVMFEGVDFEDEDGDADG